MLNILIFNIKFSFQGNNIEKQNELYGDLNKKEIMRQNQIHLNIYQCLTQPYIPFRNNNFLYNNFPQVHINQIPYSIPFNRNEDKAINNQNSNKNHTIESNNFQNQNIFLTYNTIQNCDENWSKEDFIEKTTHYVLPICCKVRGKSELKGILNNIWKYVSNKKSELSIFLAIALSNTMFFTNLKERSNEKYSKRGLLQISGLNNYKILQEINSNIINFVGNPWILECLDKHTIACTAKYWNCFIKNPHKRIENITDLLNLNNLDMYGENYYSPYSKDIQQKYLIYSILWTLYSH